MIIIIIRRYEFHWLQESTLVISVHDSQDNCQHCCSSITSINKHVEKHQMLTIKIKINQNLCSLSIVLRVSSRGVEWSGAWRYMMSTQSTCFINLISLNDSENDVDNNDGNDDDNSGGDDDSHLQPLQAGLNLLSNAHWAKVFSVPRIDLDACGT